MTIQPVRDDADDPRIRAHRAISRIEDELNERYLEREEVVRALLCTLLASENILLLGPPGAAKSEIVRDLCDRVLAGPHGMFRTLLTKFSAPEQLLGPWSMEGFSNDRYMRKTEGYAPTARMVFVDEIFEAGSALLNEFLPLLNEREFFNDGAFEPAPLQMVVGASNRLPADQQTLDALFDRFMLRLSVSYLSDAGAHALLTRSSRPGPRARSTRLSEAELAELRARVTAIDTTALVEPLMEIRRRLQEADITASDRRYVKCLRIAAAQAVIRGNERAGVEDLSILAHALWNDPSQARQVRRMVMEVASPQLGVALDLMDDAQNVYDTAMSAAEAERSMAGLDANSNLKKIQNRLLELRTEAHAAGRAGDRIDTALTAVQRMIKKVNQECLGLTFED